MQEYHEFGAWVDQVLDDEDEFGYRYIYDAYEMAQDPQWRGTYGNYIYKGGVMKTTKEGISANPGEIWLMIRLDSGFFREKGDIDVIDDIAEYFFDRGIGEISGESSGNNVMDVTFDVGNMLYAANELDKYIVNHFPGMRYRISDKYEVMFEINNDE